MAGEQLDLGTAVLELRAVGDQLRADIARVGADVQSALQPIERQMASGWEAFNRTLAQTIAQTEREIASGWDQFTRSLAIMAGAQSREIEKGWNDLGRSLDRLAQEQQTAQWARGWHDFGVAVGDAAKKADEFNKAIDAEHVTSYETLGEQIVKLKPAFDLAVKGAEALIAAGAAAGAALVALTLKTAEVAGATADTAQKIGISTTTLGGWQLAAKQAEVDAGALETGLKKLSESSVDLVAGSEEAQRAFKALGISIADVTNGDGSLRSMEEILPLVADKFAGLKDGPEKAALAVDLFGRSGLDLIPILNQGSAGLAEMTDLAVAMGFAFADDAAKAGDALGDSIDILKANVLGLGNQIGTGLFPVLQSAVDQVNTWFNANRELIAQNLTEWINAAKSAIDTWITGVRAAWEMTETWRLGLQALAQMMPSVFDSSLQGQAAALREEIASLERQLKGFEGHEWDMDIGAQRMRADLALAKTELVGVEERIRGTSAAALSLKPVLGPPFREVADAAGKAAPKIEKVGGASKEAAEAAKKQKEALSDLRESLSQAEDTYKDAVRSAGSLSEALDLNGEWYRKATAEVEAMNIADDEQTKLLHDLDVKHKEHARTLKEDFGQAAEEAADAAAQLTEELAGIREESNQLDIAEAIERGDPRRALGLIETGARDAAVALEAVARAEVYGPMTEQSVEAMQLGLRKIATDAKKAAEDVKREFGDLGILLEDAAKAIGDSMAETLGSALVEGEWDDVGDELLGILKSTIADVVSDLLKANLFRPLVNSLVGVFSGTDIGSGIFSGLAGTLGSVLPGAFTSGAEGASGSIVASLSPELGGTMAEVGATAGEAGGVAAGAAWTGAASAGIVAGAGLVGKGIYDMFSGQEVRGAVESGLAFAFVTGGASLIPALVMDLFGIGEPSQATQISTHLRKMIADSLGNADIGAGIVAGLGEIGVPVTEEIIKQITRAPRSGAFVREAFASLGPELQAGASEELRKFINGEGNATNALTMDDFILLLFPEMTDDSALRSSLQAIGQQAASLEGLTGRQAIDFADEFAKGQLVLADSLGLTNEQLMAYLDATANGMGASIESWRALEEAQIALKESGNFDAMLPGFQAYIQTITGVDVSGAQNLVDVLTASGLATDDFVLALRRYAEQNPAFVGAVDAFDASLEDARLTALGLTAGVRKLLETSANAALRAAETAGAGAAEAIAQAGDALALAGEQGREAVDELDAAAEAVRAAAEGASGAQQEALLALADSLDDASDGLSDTGEEGEDAGDSIADAMRDALDPVESLVGGIRELINTLRELNDLPPITLPPVTVPPPPTGPGSGPTSSLFSPGAFTIPSIDISRLAPLDLDLSRLAVRAPSFDFEGARRAPETVRAAPGGVPPVGYQLALVRDEDVVAGGLYRLQQSKRLSFAGGPARVHASAR